jgi:serine/threonine-protein kinase
MGVDGNTLRLRGAATSPDAAPPEGNTVQIGDILGSYRLVRLLGEGGMGRVFEARHLHLPRSVAIKVLRPELTANRRMVTRFFREAQVVNQIQHRNIVEITDFVELPGGQCFIVMELLRGAPLDALLQDHTLPVAAMVQIATAVCSRSRLPTRSM